MAKKQFKAKDTSVDELIEAAASIVETVDMETVESNMVYFSTNIPADEVVEKFAKFGVKMFDLDPRRCRIVTHLHITDEDVENFAEIIKKI